MNTEKSRQLFEEAKKYIPGGVNSPVRAFKSVGGDPLFITNGKGSKFYDADGNEYIDYPLALGPITLGYNYQRVNEAIIKQLKDGITFSLMHPLEVELAELLVDIIPCAEMVRFGKNGSDATSAAVR